jgi:hypothetical protein
MPAASRCSLGNKCLFLCLGKYADGCFCELAWSVLAMPGVVVLICCVPTRSQQQQLTKHHLSDVSSRDQRTQQVPTALAAPQKESAKKAAAARPTPAIAIASAPPAASKAAAKSSASGVQFVYSLQARYALLGMASCIAWQVAVRRQDVVCAGWRVVFLIAAMTHALSFIAYWSSKLVFQGLGCALLGRTLPELSNALLRCRLADDQGGKGSSWVAKVPVGHEDGASPAAYVSSSGSPASLLGAGAGAGGGSGTAKHSLGLGLSGGGGGGSFMAGLMGSPQKQDLRVVARP